MVNKENQVITTYKVNTYCLNSKHFAKETFFAFVGLGLKHTPAGLAVKSSLHANPHPILPTPIWQAPSSEICISNYDKALHYDVHVPAGVMNMKTRNGTQMIRMKNSHTPEKKPG
jgi:hypothetical protein